MIKKRLLVLVLSLLMVLGLCTGIASAFADEAEIPTIEDEMGPSHSARTDTYSAGSASGDRGFGDDSWMSPWHNKAYGPDLGNWWDDYGYVHYSIGGQNVAEIWVDVHKRARYVFGDIMVFGWGSRNYVAPIKIEEEDESDEYVRMHYTYVIPTSWTALRVVFTSFNIGDITKDMQALTKVKIYYSEQTPAAQNFVYVDDCGHAHGETRGDAWNLDFTREDARLVGDPGRIVVKAGGQTEAYVQYNVYGYDTMIAYFYHNVDLDDTKPPIFLYYHDSTFITDVSSYEQVFETIEPDEESGLWGISIVVFKLDDAVEGDWMRITLKSQIDENKIELGKVELFNSEYFDAGKQIAFTKLTRALLQVDEAEYSDEKFGEIIGYYNSAYESLLAAQASEVEDILDEALENMAGVMNLEEEFEYTKQQKKAELQEYVDALNEQDYTEDNWVLIQAALEEGLDAIENATSISKIIEAYEEAIDEIDSVEKIPADEEEEEEEEEQQDAGCSCSSVVNPFQLWTVIIIFAAAFIMLFRKRVQ